MRRLLTALSMASAMALCSVAANAAAVVINPNHAVSGPAVLTAAQGSGTLAEGESIFFFTSPTLTPSSAPTNVSATLGHTGIPEGSFTDTYQFFVPFGGLASGSVTTSLASLAFGTSIDTDLLSVVFNGLSAPLTYFDADHNPCPVKGVDTCGASTQFALTSVPVLVGAAGPNRIVVSGLSRGNGSYGGNGTLIAGSVPEPATWAMMLIGFGAIGLSMGRRRRPALAQIA